MHPIPSSAVHPIPSSAVHPIPSSAVHPIPSSEVHPIPSSELHPISHTLSAGRKTVAVPVQTDNTIRTAGTLLTVFHGPSGKPVIEGLIFRLSLGRLAT